MFLPVFAFPCPVSFAKVIASLFVWQEKPKNLKP